MLGFIIAIRNFIIALMLSWIGISFSLPSEDTTPPDLPTDDAPQNLPESFFRLG